MTLPVHVISLARSTDRRANFQATNPFLSYQFIDAIDGLTLTADQIVKAGFAAPGLDYTLGAYGCALSHLARWEWAMSSQTPLTIAEDDAIFRADFHQKSDEIMAKLPADWDIIMWGWNFNSLLLVDHVPALSQTIMFFSEQQLHESAKSFQAVTNSVNLFRLFIGFGVMAYSISPKGAARLKAACFPLQPFEFKVPMYINPLLNTGHDTAMSRVYAELGSYVCYPPLAISKNERSSSTVQNQPV